MYPQAPNNDPVEPTPQPEMPSPLQSELESAAGSFWSTAGAVFSWVVLPLSLVVLLQNFVFQAYRVVGESMEPTLSEGQYLIISKLGASKAMLSNVTRDKDAPYIPERGEIIVFRFPKEPEKTFVKRVVGIPGDRVVIKSGKVTVFNDENPDGFNPDSSYLKKGVGTLIETDEVVDPGRVFVIGDNRGPGASYDSRDWGELPSEFIVGNAVVRLLPLDRVTIL